MPSASYYREQARLLLQWANDAHDPKVVQRLITRAHDMIAMAQRVQCDARSNFDAPGFFNSQRMTNGRSIRSSLSED